jgi:hypothetical protein
MTAQYHATARVTLTVEVDVRSSWGGDCTVDQVNRQAAEEAVNYVEQAAAKDRRIRVIGRPVVTVVTALKS